MYKIEEIFLLRKYDSDIKMKDLFKLTKKVDNRTRAERLSENKARRHQLERDTQAIIEKSLKMVNQLVECDCGRVLEQDEFLLHVDWCMMKMYGRTTTKRPR